MKNSKMYPIDPPKPGKKTSEQVAADVATYLASGSKVQKVPRGIGLDTKPLGSMNRLGGR